MPMPMVNIWPVGMCMGYWFMCVPMTVINHSFVFSVDVVMVAIIMSMPMFMVQGFMRMRMDMLVSQQDSKRYDQNHSSRSLND